MIRLEQEINSIKNENLRQFILNCFAKGPQEFFKIPASSSGRFHPEQSNGEGGLINHTKMVCRFANILSRAYDIRQEKTDMIIAACLLHDLHKPAYDHAIKTWEWIFKNQDELTDNFKIIGPGELSIIADMIKTHMGRWTKYPYSKTLSEFTTSEWLVHLADMCATDKGLSFDFNVDWVRN